MSLQEAPHSIDVTVKVYRIFLHFFNIVYAEKFRLCLCRKEKFIIHIAYFLMFQDIQFKLHSKYQLFNINASTPNFNGIDLLTTASTFGLIIVGRPSAQEIQGLKS